MWLKCHVNPRLLTLPNKTHNPNTTAKQLEYPDAPATDYNTRDVPADFAAITSKTVDSKVGPGVR